MDHLQDQWMPYSAAVAAVAYSVGLLGQQLVDVVILALGYCVPAVYGARLMQTAYLKRRRADAQIGSPCRRRRAADVMEVPRKLQAVVAACVVIALVLVITKNHEGGDCGMSGRLWSLVKLLLQAGVTAVLLAVAFETSGSSRAELADELSKDRTSYSEGAAWLFFLGYLEMTFGENGRRFDERMDDYLTSNDIIEADRENTCRKMFIFIPMKRVAILPDRDLHCNDKTVEKEKTLQEAAVEGTRKFGETHVYKVRRNGRCYRVAMEEATPMRTADRAVDDAGADFKEADYEAFASRFLKTLEKILESKPNIGSQVELVPIYQNDQLGRTVVERLLKIQGRKEQRRWNQEREQSQEQELNQRSHSREPEENSELDY